ncbi:MAG: urea ABC transporter permease subunit UrtC [Nitrosomonadaceae bacterium]
MSTARTPFVVRFFSATGRKGWVALILFTLLTVVLVPASHLMLAESHALHVPTFYITLLGKIMCYAVVAVAMDLIWGYTGILSLTQGLFFALGGYAFGMYLMRSIGLDGVYQSHLADYMVFLDWKEYPWYWRFTEHFLYCMMLVVVAPGLLAFVFGYFVFKSRVKGVYFAIISQAMLYAFLLLFFMNNTGFGGNNGFTDFKRILGYDIFHPVMRVTLFAMSAGMLMFSLLLGRYLVSSKFGRILTAIRDAEMRVMFLGYNPLWYKLFIWVLAAIICGMAGALYVPQVGIINPSEMATANSIEIAIWTSIGGRGTLVGPAIGAIVVNLSKSWFTVAFPEYWLYFLGLMFVLVTMFFPQGIVGIYQRLRARVTR